MIVDHRTYDFHPRTLPAWMALYEAEGLSLQRHYLGHLLLLAVCQDGPVNQVVWAWGYEDMDDRTRRRAAMEADPAWWAFRQKSDGMGAIARMENELLRPTAFSPFR